jgi:hypothetical protein
MAQGDVKLEHGASAALTISLGGLASSATRVAGRESSAVTTGDWLDALVGGKVKLGTAPTVSKVVQVWVYASIEDTPIYPDVLDGTDSAETLTSENVRDAALKLGAIAVSDATTGLDLYIAPFSVAALFGGVLPKFWGIFVVHDTGVALDATGSNHFFHYTPVYGHVAP